MEKCLYWQHPAVPPINIKAGQWYTLRELKELYDMDYITTFFFPANFSWTDVEEIYPKKKDSKKEVKQTKK